MTMWLNRLFVSIITFFLISIAHASTPLWTFTPLTPTSITIPTGSTATIQYQVTNQSRKTHTLVMTPINGITQITSAGNCANQFTLGYLQFCVLTLQVTANALPTNQLIGGPIVCQQGNPLQCYQPSVANRLNIQVVF